MNTDKLTEVIIGCALRVSNALGCGFNEKVYENSMLVELNHLRIPFENQRQIKVLYLGVIVGEFIPDLIVHGQVIVEFKGLHSIDPIHQAQLLNYLKASKIHTGLILNFGTPKLGIKRMML